MNRLDRVVVPTRLMEELLVANGLNPDKAVFSRFGIRTQPHEPHRPDVAGKLRIGFIGGLSEHKGAHLLIAAVKRLRSLVALELRIYGRTDLNPAYFKKLQKLADGDQRIHFCGTFPNEKIGRYLPNSMFWSFLQSGTKIRPWSYTPRRRQGARLSPRIWAGWPRWSSMRKMVCCSKQGMWLAYQMRSSGLQATGRY